MPPEPADELSTLERLRRKLYAEGGTSQGTRRTAPPAVPAPPSEGTGWERPAPVPEGKRKLPWTVIFLAAAAGFLALALAAAAYFLVFDGRAVSTNRISLVPEGPTTAASGDVITILIPIENRNPVPALDTLLTVDFPESARAPEDLQSPARDFQDTVGDIPTGGRAERTARVALFGSQGDRIAIPVRFEYSIEGSNATFVKEAVYEVEIASSPVTVTARSLEEGTPGGTASFAVTVRSTVQEPLQDIALLAEVPFGFRLAPREGPVYGIGTLAPGEERTVTVSGTLPAESVGQQWFRFSAGITGGEASLAAAYATTQVPVTLARPFLAPAIAVNGDPAPGPVVGAGTRAQAAVSWENTLGGPILDGTVTVTLGGNALEAGSITAESGFYRSSDRTVTFSRETEPGLARLVPGGEGSGSLSFDVKSAAALAGVANPTVTLTADVAGSRGPGAPATRIPGALVREIKVATDLSLSASATANQGPSRPVADQETGYALRLSLANTLNPVETATVSGRLPSYVRYVGTISSGEGSVDYDPSTRVVTWKAGKVAPGAERWASIQVALLPSASQRGTSPVLMTGIAASGFDQFTQRQLSVEAAPVTTGADGEVR